MKKIRKSCSLTRLPTLKDPGDPTMNRHLAFCATSLLAGLFAALLAFPSMAEPADEQTDCSKARDPVRCIARQQAQIECKEKSGKEKRQCMLAKMPPPDCSKAPEPERCEAKEKARKACQGKPGKEFRACLRKQKV